jgi:hypothetical protein
MVLERPYKVLYVASRLRIFLIYLIEPGEQWWTEAPQCLYVIVTMTLSQHPSTTRPQCHALNTTSGTSCLQCYPPHWSHWFSPVGPTNQRDVPRTPLRRAICHTYNLRTQNLSTIDFSKMSTCPPDRCSRYTYRRRPYVDSGLQISSYVRKIPYTKHVRRTSGLQIFRHVRFLP